MKPYYQSRGVTLYHADCRELLPVLGADLLCTDPPYGIGVSRSRKFSGGLKARRAVTGFFAGKKKTIKRPPPRDYGEYDWDDAPPPAWIFGLMRERTKHQVIFGGNYFPLPPSRCWLVWDKHNGGTTYSDCELAWTNLKKPVRKLRWRWNGFLQEDMKHKEQRVHRAQKPLPLMKWCIEQAPADCETVLDPYAGSGTTLLAARELGREAIGIEKEEAFCQMAVARLEEERV